MEEVQMPLIDQQDIISVTDAASAMVAKDALREALDRYPPCRLVSVSLAINPKGLASLIAVVETI
jgi:hypothetical protein